MKFVGAPCASVDFDAEAGKKRYWPDVIIADEAHKITDPIERERIKKFFASQVTTFRPSVGNK